MKVLVTGANGFIGSGLREHLLKQGHQVVGSVRQDIAGREGYVAIGEVNSSTDWSVALEGVEVVIHLAALAHLTEAPQQGNEAQFAATNVDGAVALATQAIKTGVRRFIFISSIGVNGSSSPERGFTETSIPAPEAAYAVSKYEAEQQLSKLFQHSTTELVIIRPPLVYAGHAPGNFRKLLRVACAGLPLPLSAVDNRRTMVSLANLIDFLSLCVHHPKAAGELFLIGDAGWISTPDILRCLYQGGGHASRLLYVPARWLALLFRLLGRQSMHLQLCGTLVVDTDKAFRLLGWKPVEQTHEALREAAASFKRLQAKLK